MAARLSRAAARDRLVAAQETRAGIERGMILMAAGALTAPGVHALAKSLGGTMSAGQVSSARYFFQILFLLPLIWIAQGWRIPAPSLGLAIRGVVVASSGLFFFWALQYLPLATASAIFFVEPLILTALSAAFLGEPVGWRRLTAVTVGFVGALIVIRPSFAAVGYAALLPLLAALTFAIYLAMTRRQAGGETAVIAQFWVCLFGVLALSLAMGLGGPAGVEVLAASWPTAQEWALLAAMGAIALVSHRLAISAFRSAAPASILAPFQYLEIFSAILLGVMLFGDLPDAATVLGTAIIIGSGLYVFRREQALARRRQ
jgi:drug/metabolite transporter (DMT)-like permease